MKRNEAGRRHRQSVALIAALAGALILLLQTVAPRVERAYDDRGIRPTATVEAIFRAGHFVADRAWLVAALAAVLVALLWSAYGLLDRPSTRSEG